MALGHEDTASRPSTATWSTRPVGRRREDRIVGASRATERVIEQLAAAARSDLPVLILGACGTGKEFAARAVHSWGPRSDAPFVTLACDAIPDALQMREVFGAAPASPDADGALSRAGSGTLYLEAAERLRPEVADALLRAVSDRRFRRVGDDASVAFAARLIVAAEARPEASMFGASPHHSIELVPLAERREDILPLAAHFLAASAEEIGVAPVGFTSDARAFLLAEPWEGNVRELRQRIRQAVRLCSGGAVTAEALLLAGDGDEIPSFKEAKRAFETRYVVNLLRRCGGNISRAARLAKKDRKDFYDVIRRTGIDPTQFR
ncbi:Transcriptional regulatory protein QseF [Myxococcaceae bacterium]|jgi:two-component system response regulator GlrR|nr:Transcriptional regulatory protein QseF [Myxococcaceae bacterium]